MKKYQEKMTWVSISKINPAAYNPRRISEKAFEGLKESLRQNSIVQPLVVNKQTGNLVAGHQRFRALTELGYEKVPVITVDVSLDKEKQMNVSLNNPAIEGEFTGDLQNLLEGIKLDLGEAPFEELRLDTLVMDIDRVFDEEPKDPEPKEEGEDKDPPNEKILLMVPFGSKPEILESLQAFLEGYPEVTLK